MRFCYWSSDVCSSDLTERQFYDNARLNKAISFKYPNFDMDISEFVSSSGMKKERPVETCMYFPYDSAVPQDGGHGVYLREDDFTAKLKYFKIGRAHV